MIQKVLLLGGVPEVNSKQITSRFLNITSKCGGARVENRSQASKSKAVSQGMPVLIESLG